jgi:ribonuclease HI
MDYEDDNLNIFPGLLKKRIKNELTQIVLIEKIRKYQNVFKLILITNFKGKKNKDLWLRFLEVYKKHQIRFTWVKGHNGHLENERCDELAVEASKQNNLLIDTYFEKEELKLNL